MVRGQEEIKSKAKVVNGPVDKGTNPKWQGIGRTGERENIKSNGKGLGGRGGGHEILQRGLECQRAVSFRDKETMGQGVKGTRRRGNKE